MNVQKITVAAFVCLLIGAWAWVSEPNKAEGATEGCLIALDEEKKPLGACPLKHTDVQVDISGFLARVTLTQQFENPFEEPIEAVYTFPMSDRAAVDAMTMKIGDRVIKGLIKRREEAQRIYQAARDAGQAASLLDQERPNIFTQSVANIMPGDRIEIEISYVEYLKYEDGEYEFSFPMVVGPRYIPGTPPGNAELQPGNPKRGWARPTDQVPDADRITPPVTPEGTRAGHDIALSVHIDAGLPIQDIQSALHEVDTERPSENQAVVRLKNKREIPNRDFVLKYRVAGGEIEDAMLTHAGAQGGFFTLILQPPKRVAPEMITPKEMVFVIDCSGSMSGFPIEKAKKTMRLCIEQMNPNDTFNLVSFAGGTGYCFKSPVSNTPANRRQALAYLESLEGGGGTEMMGAIRAALGNQNDPERLRIVCFMTDGFIGNDMAILDAIQKNAQTARVFSFGIGNGVNRFLLEGMGRVGRGAAEIVTLESDGDAAAKRFHERIHSPILTDITVGFGGVDVREVYPDPGAIPDLFSAQPLVLKGRYDQTGQGTVTVRGNTAAGPFERKIDVYFPADAAEHDVLAPLWARARIDWLMDQDWLGAQQGQPDPKIKEAVTQLGLEFGLMTQYTSFVAVEEKVINENGKPKTVQVPVEMTDGVSYEGVFGSPLCEAAPRTQAGKSLAYRSGAAGMPQANVLFSEEAKVHTFAPNQPAPRPVAKPDAGGQVDKDESGGLPEDKEQDNSKAKAKIDPALRDLDSKLVNGNYQKGAVKVVNGYVEVFIKLTDDTEDNIAALKAAGAKITSRAASSKRVLARVRVANLEAIAALACVQRIEPPTF